MDNDYYQFIHSGKLKIDGLSVLGATHLIPLKARAWLDLNNRKNMGASIDDKDIRKHKNDVIRLYQLLTPTQRISLPQLIKRDMQDFLDHIQNDRSIDFKNLGIKNIKTEDLFINLRSIYAI